MEQMLKEKEQLNEIGADLEHHNQQLQTVVSSKTAEIKEYLARVENQCFERSQILDENERLDDIIGELQRKNKELSESMATNMFNQAQQFKQRGLLTLTKNSRVASQGRTKGEEEQPGPGGHDGLTGGQQKSQK